MQVIETGQPICREMNFWQRIFHKASGWCYRNISRRLPRLVWIGDEVDISVNFHHIGNLGGAGIDPVNLYQAQNLLNELGITFDTGSGCRGRDWEWDWSLHGPISLKFRGRAREPELRRTQPDRPVLNLVS
jgi:hypothetical protein